jgi:hypothetical protein
VLYIYVNSLYVTVACADTGSRDNCITTRFAGELHTRIFHEPKEFDLLVRGRTMQALGYVWIKCQFPEEPYLPKSQTWQKFFVFNDLGSKIIFGRQFLRDTKTLDLHQHRLHKAEARQDHVPLVRCLGSMDHGGTDGQERMSTAGWMATLAEYAPILARRSISSLPNLQQNLGTPLVVQTLPGPRSLNCDWLIAYLSGAINHSLFRYRSTIRSTALTRST